MRTTTHRLLDKFGTHLVPRDLTDGQIHRLAGVFDRTGAALDRLETAAAKAREIRADRDLTADAKARKVRELLSAELAAARDAVEHNRATISAHRDRARKALEDKARPKGGGEGWEQVARELRLDRAQRALESLPAAERYQLILEHASRGSRDLLDAARLSYVPLLQADTIAMLENRWAMVAAPDAAAEVADAEDLVEAVEHLTVTVERGLFQRILGEGDLNDLTMQPRSEESTLTVDPAELAALAVEQV